MESPATAELPVDSMEVESNNVIVDVSEAFVPENGVSHSDVDAKREEVVGPAEQASSSAAHADNRDSVSVSGTTDLNSSTTSLTKKALKAAKRKRKSQSGEESSSDEEASYQKSLRTRALLEQLDKKELEDLREKLDQEYVNMRFFSRGRRRPAAKAVATLYPESLLSANLWDPPPPPEDYEPPADELPWYAQEQNPSLFAVPAVRCLTEDDEARNAEADKAFAKRWRSGRIIEDDERAAEVKGVPFVPGHRTPKRDADFLYDNDVSSASRKSDGGRKSDTPKTGTGRPVGRPPKNPELRSPAQPKHKKPKGESAANGSDALQPVDKERKDTPRKSDSKHVFEKSDWSDAEVAVFRELVSIMGDDFFSIAHLLMSRSATQMQLFYDENNYAVICRVCGCATDDERLLLCDACDRPCHMFCLRPPLDAIPETDWFCDACRPDAAERKVKCATCTEADLPDRLFSCGVCHSSFHPGCLSGLYVVPYAQWACPNCLPALLKQQPPQSEPSPLLPETPGRPASSFADSVASERRTDPDAAPVAAGALLADSDAGGVSSASDASVSVRPESPMADDVVVEIDGQADATDSSSTRRRTPDSRRSQSEPSPDSPPASPLDRSPDSSTDVSVDPTGGSVPSEPSVQSPRVPAASRGGSGGRPASAAPSSADSALAAGSSAAETLSLPSASGTAASLSSAAVSSAVSTVASAENGAQPPDAAAAPAAKVPKKRGRKPKAVNGSAAADGSADKAAVAADVAAAGRPSEAPSGSSEASVASEVPSPSKAEKVKTPKQPKPRREPTIKMSTRSRGSMPGDEGPKRVAKLAASFASDLALQYKFETLKQLGNPRLFLEHLGLDSRGTVRDDNLAALRHDSVFNLVATSKLDPAQLGDHLEAVMVASEHAVQAMLNSPGFVTARGLERPPKSASSAAPLPDDGFGDGPRAWIFQANENIYDICSSVQQLKVMTWFIRQHTQRIHRGDRVFIWVSGKDAGIIATAAVLTEPAVIPECKGMGRFYLVPSDLNRQQLRSEIAVDYVLPERIAKPFVAAHPVLGGLQILRAPIGTNFRLSRVEANAIHAVMLDKAGPRGASAVPPLLPPPPSDATPDVPVAASAGSAGAENEGATTRARCEVCRAANDDAKMLLCEECNKVYHPHCLQPPLDAVPSGPWSCPACIELAAKKCQHCSSAENGETMLLCDRCDLGYHMGCLNPPLTVVPPEPLWFCPTCCLSDDELILAKIVLGTREAHVETRRLLRDKCLQLFAIHKTNLLERAPRDKVHTDLASVAGQIQEFKQKVLTATNAKLDAWRQAVVRSALLSRMNASANVPNT